MAAIEREEQRRGLTLSVSKVAREMGLCRQQLHDIIHRRSWASARQILNMVRALNMTDADLRALVESAAEE